MKIEKLNNYRGLYKSSGQCGEAEILRDYLKLENDFPVPLSISHGVDMNHLSVAMDVRSIKPIHWSYNQQIHERALLVKPSILLPHPWLMLTLGRKIKSGSGFLVVGPPPGRSNDQALLHCLRKQGFDSANILLKYRGRVDASKEFWEANGFSVVSAGERDRLFYQRLLDLLQSYDCIVGCTLSSALIFAAAIGKKCHTIEDYTYTAYDTPDYLSCMNFNSLVAAQFVDLIRRGEFAAASQAALDLLGSGLLGNRIEARERLCTSLADLQYPVYFPHGGGVVSRYVILKISKHFNKVGLLQYGLKGYARRRIKKNQIGIISTNEIDVWINGVNSDNFSFKLVPYVRGVTEPGWAID